MPPVKLRATAVALAVAAAGTGLAACGSSSSSSTTTSSTRAAPATTTTTAPKNLLAALSTNPQLRLMTLAFESAGLADTLYRKGPYIVLATTGAGFRAAPKETLATVLDTKNRTQLVRYASYNLVPGSGPLTPGTVTTVEGGTITVSQEGGKTVLTDATGAKATVTAPGITTANGTVYAIDGILQPGP
jgi:uncharacterized surface protein with fasciclin (FAS1) repeats